MVLLSRFILKLLYENVSENLGFAYSASLVMRTTWRHILPSFAILRGTGFAGFRSSADLN